MGFFIKIMHQLLKNMLHAIVESVNFNKKTFVETMSTPLYLPSKSIE